MSDDERKQRRIGESEMDLTENEKIKPVWQDAWREFQDPYLGPDTQKFPSPFESFVAGYMAALRAQL